MEGTVTVPADLHALGGDLLAETAELAAIVVPLGPARWSEPTPAVGWTIHDQVSHLAYFDEATVTAVRDPDRFRAERGPGLEDADAFTAAVAARHRDMAPAEVWAWFERARATLVDVFRHLDPATRVPWYGPDMSSASALTARIMETWAHGQDVADAVGVERRPTAALRQVAHLGVRALPNSFRARGLPVPDTAVRVELRAPAGDLWAWGEEGAVDVVRGPALDFCHVATQRRHLADPALEVTGPVAAAWMAIAQAFAGPPGAGRAPTGAATPGAGR
jgi:uncharacterized protein (TIGR03084 family)